MGEKKAFTKVRDLVDELGKDMEKEEWIEFLDEIINDLSDKKQIAEDELAETEGEDG